LHRERGLCLGQPAQSLAHTIRRKPSPPAVILSRPVDDCCRAAQNLMLSAPAQGLGTCWVGSPPAWLKTEEARTTLRIPPRISGAGAGPTGAASTADHLGELSLQPHSPHDAKRKRGEHLAATK
jgi:nitroreductase